MNPLEPTHSVRVQLAKCRFEEKGGGVPSEPRVGCVVCRGVGCVTVMPEDGLIAVQVGLCPPAPRWLSSASFALLCEVYMGLGFYPWAFPSTQGVSESRPHTAGMATPPGRRTGSWSRRSPRSRPHALAISEVAEPRAAPRTRWRCGLHAGRRSAVNFAALGTGYRSDVTRGV